MEQRILEQSARIPSAGALTAWAALRWFGAGYFEGLDVDRTPLPVPVVLGGWADIGHGHGISVSRERFWPAQRELVDEVPCALPERALFDEMRRCRGLVPATVAADMTFAASVTTLGSAVSYVAGCPGWTGVGVARAALSLAVEDSRSPQESRMRLIWVLVAELPQPLCNKPVFDLGGQLLGYPDLFDPVAGLVGEYDGADHLELDRRRKDASREEQFRDHGLGYFELVRGDLSHPVQCAERMHSVRRRCLFLPEDQRQWTLTPPPWWLGRSA